MEFIIWIIIAILVFSVRSSKKKQEEERKKARENTAWQGQPSGANPNLRGVPGTQPPPAPTVAPTVEQGWPWQQAAPVAKPPQPEYEGEWSWTEVAQAGKRPPVPTSQEGWPWPVVPAAPQQPRAASPQRQWSEEGAATLEGQTQEGTAPIAPAVSHRMKAYTPLKSTLAHTLRPASQSQGHAHKETSMTGEEPCPPSPAGSGAAKPGVALRGKPLSAPLTNVLRMDRESIVTGLLYMEILGKPKAMQRSRLHHS
ncbi:MAG: hypothetical protein AAGU74_06380 [Bacillota bacterium]